MVHHTFVDHIAIRTSFGVLAWVPRSLAVGAGVADVHGDELHMMRCTFCGEQGYAIPA